VKAPEADDGPGALKGRSRKPGSGVTGRDMATSWLRGSKDLPRKYGTRRPVTKVRRRAAFGVCLQIQAAHRVDRYFDSTIVISLRRTGSRW
jgi:hypothetical protein